LRQRLIEDMAMRKLSPKTQTGYIRAVKKLTDFLDRSPDTATAEDLRQFQLHLVSNGTSSITLNTTITALRFFFGVTLDRPEVVGKMSFVREPRKVPLILSPEEVKRLLDAVSTLKYKAALSIAYGAGLRASEVVHLKITDIDSQRMVLRVEQGKGSKDRYALLSPRLLALLRAWWRKANQQGVMYPGGWLFPGRNLAEPISPRSLNRVCKQAVHAAGLNKRVSLHTLRHSFATHLLEQDVDIRVIQVLLGHKKLETTAGYVQVAAGLLHKTTSPLDQLESVELPTLI
jgi:site-specific recombinase XerD